MQELDVVHLFFAAAQDEGRKGDGAIAAAALRLAQGFRKKLSVRSVICGVCPSEIKAF